MRPFCIHRSSVALLSRSDHKMPKLSPVGSHNGLIGQYLWNRKTYDPKTMLCSQICGHSSAIYKWFEVLISIGSQNAQIEPNGQPKWHFWPISWERKEKRRLLIGVRHIHKVAVQVVQYIIPGVYYMVCINCVI